MFEASDNLNSSFIQLLENLLTINFSVRQLKSWGQICNLNYLTPPQIFAIKKNIIYQIIQIKIKLNQSILGTLQNQN